MFWKSDSLTFINCVKIMAIASVRYSDEELQEFKALIVTKLDSAHNQVVFIREQMMEINENSQQSGDWTDESSSHTEMEMLNKTLARQVQFVRSLENALLRIQNKTYGVCTVSGQLIDKNRLLLVPHATKSVEAKNDRPIQNTSPHTDASRNRADDETTAEPEEKGAMQKEFFDNE
jgi:RNA polymerase-binding transcription factor DksA